MERSCWRSSSTSRTVTGRFRCQTRVITASSRSPSRRTTPGILGQKRHRVAVWNRLVLLGHGWALSGLRRTLGRGAVDASCLACRLGAGDRRVDDGVFLELVGATLV